MGAEAQSSSSFSSWAVYGRALRQMPSRVRQRVAIVRTPAEERTTIKLRSGAEMCRKLQWYDVMALGVGGMLGAGVFITTGKVAQEIGPSIILSYVVAGISALLSSFCYTEFAMDVPVAGGAFSYLRVTFGEFAGFITGANLMMEYVLSNAAVSRSFTSYFSSIFLNINNNNYSTNNMGENAWRVQIPSLKEGFNMLDVPAVLLIATLTLFICYSTKNSSILNIILTVFHILLVLFIIIACFMNGNWHNLTEPAGFAPEGARGVFNGAAIVYLSYIGYDAVSTMAEEVKIPDSGMPIGVSGSVVVVSVLYSLMATSLSVMLPFNQIAGEAAFSNAFSNIEGWRWATNVVGVGSSLGIVTSLLVAMLGQARYMCVIGRANLIPQWFAQVNPRTGTPINAAVFLGCCTSVVAFFTDLDILLGMVSIGTIFVFYMVSNALVYHRYTSNNNAEGGINYNHWPTILFLVMLSGSAIGFAILWRVNYETRMSRLWWGMLICIILSLLLNGLFWMRSRALPTTLVVLPNKSSTTNQQEELKWRVPFMPWLASLSIFLNVFLLSSLDTMCFKRFGIWTIACILFYAFYSVHATFDAESSSIDHMQIQTTSLCMGTFSSPHPQPNGVVVGGDKAFTLVELHTTTTNQNI